MEWCLSTRQRRRLDVYLTFYFDVQPWCCALRQIRNFIRCPLGFDAILFYGGTAFWRSSRFNSVKDVHWLLSILDISSSTPHFLTFLSTFCVACSLFSLSLSCISSTVIISSSSMAVLVLSFPIHLILPSHFFYLISPSPSHHPLIIIRFFAFFCIFGSVVTVRCAWILLYFLFYHIIEQVNFSTKICVPNLTLVALMVYH